MSAVLLVGLTVYCAYLFLGNRNGAHAAEKQQITANGPGSEDIQSDIGEARTSQEDSGLTESFDFEVFGKVQV